MDFIRILVQCPKCKHEFFLDMPRQDIKKLSKLIKRPAQQLPETVEEYYDQLRKKKQ